VLRCTLAPDTKISYVVVALASDTHVEQTCRG